MGEIKKEFGTAVQMVLFGTILKMNIKTRIMDKDSRDAAKFLVDMEGAYKSFRPKQPMTDGQGNILVSLLMSNTSPGYTESLPGEILDGDDVSKRFQMIYDGVPLARVLQSRLEGMTGRRMTLPAIIFVGSLLKGLSDAVMAAHYIHRRVPREKRVITIDDCATYAFGDGSWSDVDREMIWSIQKRGGYRPDNWLDHREAWI